MKHNLEILNSELFRWDNSVRMQGISITELFDFDENIPICKIIGYCDSSHVTVCPNENSYAVMFEYDNNEDTWMHIPKKYFDLFVRKLAP